MAFWNPVGIQPEPKASSEPINKQNVFEKSWYLFFNSLQMAVGAILAALQDFFGTGPIITDTHANKSSYDPVKFQRFAYLETDRRLTYVSQQPAGTVTTVGTAVTWVSGQLFSPLWVGKTINIGNMPFVVSAVGSTTGLTLTASAGTISSPIAFVLQQFYWLYTDGIMHVSVLAGLPGDLAIEDAGAIVDESQYDHSYTWNGSVYQFSQQDDHMAGQMAAAVGGGPPLAGVWQICDGSSVAVSKGDGTTVSLTTPDFSTNTFIAGNATETGVIAATAPSWATGAKTDDESAHTHPLTVVGINYTIGGSSINVESLTVTGAGSAHHHTLSNANAPLKAPSPTNGGLPQYAGLVFFMRR